MGVNPDFTRSDPDWASGARPRNYLWGCELPPARFAHSACPRVYRVILYVYFPSTLPGTSDPSRNLSRLPEGFYICLKQKRLPVVVPWLLWLVWRWSLGSRLSSRTRSDELLDQLHVGDQQDCQPLVPPPT